MGMQQKNPNLGPPNEIGEVRTSL